MKQNSRFALALLAAAGWGAACTALALTDARHAYAQMFSGANTAAPDDAIPLEAQARLIQDLASQARLTQELTGSITDTDPTSVVRTNQLLAAILKEVIKQNAEIPDCQAKND